ncbi:hypothetical protein SAMN05518672_103665 [Chitinophaga sp. CF118]|uniref:hypothetical protein n=1 Tax=Chitinophaga sp. CF118 TaxID=1884367 RepID=UPI0008E75BF1|nr:hypothetical protein [Chitinophaga sp. CF118]SFD88104.1 hypothetical protein SAMN05518672_103665 [Chitinophaga sp. CF118]
MDLESQKNPLLDWPLVIEFIRQRAPAFLSQLVGVPDEVISTLIANRDVMLPASYVEFLRLMGINSNGYFPFGGMQDHTFPSIIERFEDDEEDAPPAGRFFPVAIETDLSMDPLYDHYLDLQRGNGNDAPLVMLEPGVPFKWQTPIETSETFNERITKSVFCRFQLHNCTERDVVAMGGGKLQAGGGSTALQQALALLQRIGFTPALPLLGRVVCVQAGPLSVLAGVNEEYELLTMQLGGNNSLAVKELADQLLKDLPGARQPAGPRNKKK